MRLAAATVTLLFVTSTLWAHGGDEPPVPYLSPADRSAVTVPDGPRPIEPTGRQLPLEAPRHIGFDTDEGTWMSLDVSPGGRTLLFDLLGDLYRLDSRGGPAKRVTSGLAFDAQPTFSPDGKWIAFVSDRSGAENLWIARPDGSQARQLSFGDDDTVLVSPAWSADGRSLFVSRYRPGLNGYELWRRPLDGDATLLAPIRATPDAGRESWISTLGATASRDGRFLYFARRTGSLDFEEVDEWTIVRRDLASGAEETIVAEPNGPGKALNPGAAFRPALSPDGRLLAYAHRIDGRTELRLRDLETNADRRLLFPIEHDQLQASMWQDIVPRYAFAPDGRSILITLDGGFARVSVDDDSVTRIPFTAHVDIGLGASTRADIREETGPVRARIIQTPEASPDGRTLAFSALARLYLMPLDGSAKPHPVDTGGAPSFMPSWSPDGRSIAFVTWTAAEAGHVWIAPADGSAPPRRITSHAAYYTSPVFTPDGKTVLALRSEQAQRMRLAMEYGLIRNADLIALPAAGGEARRIANGKMGSKPQFTAESGVVYLLFEDGLHRIDLATGADKRVALVTGPGWYFQQDPVPVDDVRISPDGKWLLAQIAQQLHLVAMPPADKPVVDLSDPHAPHRRITDIGADFFEWADGGRTVTWSVGSTFYRRPFGSIALNPANRPSWTADAPETGDAVSAFEAPVLIPRDAAEGRLLLRGARAITMAGDQVIEDADILIDGPRIAAIGRRGEIDVPADATILDMRGKTILPGFIDTHDHVGAVRRGVLDLADWSLRARLAYGVTTSFDPSTLTIDPIAYQDLLDAGLMVGPRLPSTGVALFSMTRFRSPEDVERVLRRYRDHYRLHNIKEYRTGSRIVRQWIAQKARELGLQPTTEGALSMKLDLTQILDGYAGNEHALVAAPLRRDVIELMARSGVGYTTTLQITNGGPPAQDHYIAAENPHDDPKFRRFTPHFIADQRTLRRQWRRPEEYRYPEIAADAARIQRGGGLVGMGAHGEMPGIGFHWEMEAHTTGGMTPIEVLHAATIGAARVIGRDAEFGSLEAGKFADLVILDRDPREDIRNTRAIAQVMKNGRLYDGDTLDEVWPRERPLGPSWFAGSDSEADSTEDRRP